jgi:hypothetical protein
LKLVRDTPQVKGYQTIEAETGEEGVRLASSVLGHHRGGDCDDWSGACYRIGPQPLQSFDTIDTRQLDVH